MIVPADRDWVCAQARAAGFDLAGLAAVPDLTSEAAREHDRRYSAWVQAGHAGEMEYLKRQTESGELVRGALHRAMPWARSVLVGALNYNSDAPHSLDPAPADAGWIGRYAWSGRPLQRDSKQQDPTQQQGSDYHDVLLPMLRSVESAIKQRFGASCQTRSYVDTGPLVERNYAQRAGIGWVGKNTCVLNQEQGSWLLLGVVITSLELAPEAITIPAEDRCGTCTRCMDACPTDALIAPRQMDATRCIAYLTIEKKGTIAEDLRPLMGRQVFGCDICQDVCPWNRRAPVAVSDALPVRRELVNPALEWLAAMDGSTFNRWFRGSPLERTRRSRVLRNVAIAMGNSGDPAFVPKLQQWTTEEDAVLAEAAAWALSRLQPVQTEPPENPPVSVD